MDYMITITNRSTGLDLGTYVASSAHEAIEAMHRDAGYLSTADAAEQLDSTVEALLADLIVTSHERAERNSLPPESGEFPLTANGSVPYYAVARMMAAEFPDFDWDAWKDQMKEGL